MRNPFKRREPYRFQCVAPGCNGIFFTVSVSLTKRRDKLPDIDSINGELTCTTCGWRQGYARHVAISRGWSDHDDLAMAVDKNDRSRGQRPVH